MSLSVLLKKLDFCVKSFVFLITFYDNFDPTAASKHGLAMEYMQNKNTSRCNQKFLGIEIRKCCMDDTEDCIQQKWTFSWFFTSFFQTVRWKIVAMEKNVWSWGIHSILKLKRNEVLIITLWLAIMVESM